MFPISNHTENNLIFQKLTMCSSLLQCLELNDTDSLNIWKKHVKTIESHPKLRIFFSPLLEAGTHLTLFNSQILSGPSNEKIRKKCFDILQDLVIEAKNYAKRDLL